ncbi:MAG: sigma-70 family RNA polymerase sigma factor [Bacteroidota bacterium]
MIFFNKKRNKLSDIDLIDKYIQSGNSGYFGLIFEKYYHLVFGVCLKYLNDNEESKDAVLQIFEFLLNKIKNEKIENFPAWLYSVTKNHCLMHIRSKNRRLLRERKFSEDSDSFDEILNNFNKENIDINILYSAINSLKKEQKICITLFYIEEKTCKEIHDITGFSLPKIKSYIQNGKLNLKKIIKK